MAEQQLTRTVAWPTARIDVDPVPALICVSTRPRIYVVDGFVSSEEATRLEALGSPSVLRANDIHTKSDATGFSFELPDHLDPLVAEVRLRIERALGVRNEQGGTLRYRRYDTGTSHPPHHDHYEIEGTWLVATAMVCLTDVDAGGETRFPLATPRIEVAPRQGRLIVWLDHREDGSPDPWSLHDGAPVRQGTKTTVTEFIYGDPETSPLLQDGPAALTR